MFGSWTAGALYLLASVTRVAFYNVEQDVARFVGVPAPAAALLCVTSLLIPAPQWAASWPLVAGGVLMVAPIAIRRPGPIGVAMFATWALALAGALGSRVLASILRAAGENRPRDQDRNAVLSPDRGPVRVALCCSHAILFHGSPGLSHCVYGSGVGEQGKRRGR